VGEDFDELRQQVAALIQLMPGASRPSLKA